MGQLTNKHKITYPWAKEERMEYLYMEFTNRMKAMEIHIHDILSWQRKSENIHKYYVYKVRSNIWWSACTSLVLSPSVSTQGNRGLL